MIEQVLIQLIADLLGFFAVERKTVGIGAVFQAHLQDYLPSLAISNQLNSQVTLAQLRLAGFKGFGEFQDWAVRAEFIHAVTVFMFRFEQLLIRANKNIAEQNLSMGW